MILKLIANVKILNFQCERFGMPYVFISISFLKKVKMDIFKNVQNDFFEIKIRKTKGVLRFRRECSKMENYFFVMRA